LGLGPSYWSSCEWFPFVYFLYSTSFGHSIHSACKHSQQSALLKSRGICASSYLHLAVTAVQSTEQLTAIKFPNYCVALYHVTVNELHLTDPVGDNTRCINDKHNSFIMIYYHRATCFDSFESSSGPPMSQSKTI
jgi:hypothetical protein